MFLNKFIKDLVIKMGVVNRGSIMNCYIINNYYFRYRLIKIKEDNFNYFKLMHIHKYNNYCSFNVHLQMHNEVRYEHPISVKPYWVYDFEDDEDDEES